MATGPVHAKEYGVVPPVTFRSMAPVPGVQAGVIDATEAEYAAG